MKGKKLYWNHLIVHLILLAGIIVVVFPFLWMIFTSFKTTGESMRIPPTVFPEKFVTDAYTTIMSSAIPFGRVYLNTILSTLITTVAQIIFCSMAGYAFARIDFPFKNAIFILVLSVLMVPGQIFLIPSIRSSRKWGFWILFRLCFCRICSAPSVHSLCGSFSCLCRSNWKKRRS